MEWFKHSTGSHDDPDISDAMDEFGDAGYSVFFITLEIYAQEFNHLNPGGWLSISRTFVQRKLRKSSTKVEQILNFYSDRQRICVKFDDKNIHINSPKFIDIVSNWTKRTKKSPTEAPTEAPTAKEEEEKKKRREDIKKDADAPLFELPSKEIIQEASEPKIEQEIKIVTKQLYEEKIFTEVHAFKNTMLKAKKNNRSILHVLTRCYLTKPKDPWAFCQKIIKSEDLNYNERDYCKSAK